MHRFLFIFKKMLDLSNAKYHLHSSVDFSCGFFFFGFIVEK